MEQKGNFGKEWSLTVRKMVREPVLNMDRYVPGRPISEVIRELGLTSVIKLASNENPLGPSPKAINAVRKALPDLNLYPDDTAYALRQAIAGHHKVNYKQIILGNGGAELIKMIGMTFLNSDDEVLLGAPSFGIYREDIKQTGCLFKEVPLTVDFIYDLDAFLTNITNKTKLIIICSPNNPTGTIVTHKCLDKFLEKVPKTVIVVLDEAYFDFVDSPEYHDGISLLPKFPNLFVLRTFSKNYGLAGLRVGYGISDEEIVFHINKVRVLFNVNSLAQIAAIAALEDKEHLASYRHLVLEEKQFLYEQLTALGYLFLPTYANFIVVKVPDEYKGDDYEFAGSILRCGIIVRPGRDQRMPGYVRITIGTREMNKKLISSLSSVRRKGAIYG